MKIAIPIVFFSKPGGARVLSMLASEWVAAGHTVTFLCTAHSDVPYYPTSAEIVWLDDDGFAVASNRNDGLCELGGKKFVLNNLFALLKGINRYASDYDVVLANLNLTAWSVFFSRTKAKKFYYVQAYEPEYYESRTDKRAVVLNYLARFTYWLPLHRIVNAPLYLSYKWLKAEYYVPPGIDFDAFYQKQPTNTGPSGRPVILGCIGRKEIEKGTRYVFEAFEILLRKGHNVELHVAFGNLPAEQTAHPKCKIIIPKNDKELGEYYRSLDIMIAPGLVQLGAPHYPVMEAMACGVPVVTTGYLPATNDNAWIVPVKDAPAIASAVIDILADTERAKTKIAHGTEAIADYTWPAVSKKMAGIFEATKAENGK